MLYPDWTTFLQMGLFLLVYAVLSKVLFRPFLRLQDLRAEATAGEEQAEDDALSDQVSQLEEVQRALGIEIGALREAALGVAAQEASATLAKAHEEAAITIAEANANLEKTYAAVAHELDSQQDAMVTSIVGCLTGAWAA